MYLNSLHNLCYRSLPLIRLKVSCACRYFAQPYVFASWDMCSTLWENLSILRRTLEKYGNDLEFHWLLMRTDDNVQPFPLPVILRADHRTLVIRSWYEWGRVQTTKLYLNIFSVVLFLLVCICIFVRSIIPTIQNTG